MGAVQLFHKMIALLQWSRYQQMMKLTRRAVLNSQALHDTVEHCAVEALGWGGDKVHSVLEWEDKLKDMICDLVQ